MQHPKMQALSQTRTAIIMDYGDTLRVNLHINHNHDYAPDYQESTMKIEGIKGAIRIQLGLILDYPTGRPDKVEYITEDGKGWRELEVKGSWFNEAFIGTMGGLMKKLEDPSYHYMNSVEAVSYTHLDVYKRQVMSMTRLKKLNGVSALDFAKGLLDHGVHPPTMYFPLIVDEALMVEPTETESKETLDNVVDIFKEIYKNSVENPEAMHEAPHSTPVRRLDEVGAARNPVLKYSGWK